MGIAAQGPGAAAAIADLRADVPASMVDGESFQEAELQRTEGPLVLYAVGERLGLVLVLDAAANLALTHRKARAMALRLAGPSVGRRANASTASQLAAVGHRAP